jgi:hypothetical protein
VKAPATAYAEQVVTFKAYQQMLKKHIIFMVMAIIYYRPTALFYNTGKYCIKYLLSTTAREYLTGVINVEMIF